VTVDWSHHCHSRVHYDTLRRRSHDKPKLPQSHLVQALVTISVWKTRALRKVRLDTLTGKAEEVDEKIFIDRGLGCELTELKVAGKAYCSLAFEAFPNDSAMDAAFTAVVEAFVDGLTAFDLTAADSQSYPAFLDGIIAA
jgi:hypothetical protein